MRPPSLVRRWPDVRQLIAGLSLVVIALALLGYWAWQASVRRHQVAIELLRSHAELAAQRLGARMQNELYLGGMAVFGASSNGAATNASPSNPAALLVAAKSAEACNCVPALKPLYALETDLTRTGTMVAGSAPPSSTELESVLAAMRDQLADMPTGWHVAVLRGKAGLGGRVILFTRRGNTANPPVFVAVASDSATIREFIVRPLLCNTPLVLAGDRTHGIHNDSLVAVRITDASGVELYRTPTDVDASIARASRHRYFCVTKVCDPRRDEVFGTLV